MMTHETSTKEPRLGGCGGCLVTVVAGFVVLMIIGNLSNSGTRSRSSPSESYRPPSVTRPSPSTSPSTVTPRGTDSWTTQTDVASGSDMALSGFVVPTGTGSFAGNEAAGTARVGVVCGGTNDAVGVVLPQQITMNLSTVPVRVDVDGRVEALTDAIMNDNVLIIGSRRNGFTDRIAAGNTLRVRMGQASTGFMTWAWSLRGSRSAIQRACG